MSGTQTSKEDIFEAAQQVYHHGLLTQRVTKHILASGDETATGSSKKKKKGTMKAFIQCNRLIHKHLLAQTVDHRITNIKLVCIRRYSSGRHGAAFISVIQ